MPEFHFAPGRIYAVIGSNGSGKSTLAAVLAGVCEADSGKLHLEREGVLRYMPQKSYPFRMSVRNNLLLSVKDGARADLLLKALQIDSLSDRRAHRLSGGETARMALARVLMAPCDLLILDEPTAAADIESTQLAEEQILAYREETGAAVILITHSLRQAQRLADEFLFFHKGQLTETGPVKDGLNSPRTPELRQFIDFYPA